MYNFMESGFQRWYNLGIYIYYEPGISRPTLYISFIESLALAHYYLAVMYSNQFKSEEVLKFLRKLEKYSKKYCYEQDLQCNGLSVVKLI